MLPNNHDAPASVKKLSTPITGERSEVTHPSPQPTIPATITTRKRNAEESPKEVHLQAEQDQSGLKAAAKVNGNAVHCIGEAKVKKADQVNLGRPSNPFAKPSSNQESPSLFDSLKKMRKS